MDHEKIEQFREYIDTRLNRLEDRFEKRFDKQDSLLQSLLKFKHEAIGRGVKMATVAGLVTTGIIQIAIAFFRSRT